MYDSDGNCKFDRRSTYSRDAGLKPRLYFPVLFVCVCIFLVSCSLTSEVDTRRKSTNTVSGLTDFTSLHPDSISVDDNLHTVTLENTGGNHHAIYTSQAGPTDNFTMEADVMFQNGDDEGILSAALLFGVERPETPDWKWYGANIDTSRSDREDMFRVFGTGITGTSFTTKVGGEMGEIDTAKPIHLKIDVTVSGNFTYSFGNTGGGELRSITGIIPDWTGGGYIGILTYRSSAKFSNITFSDRSVGQNKTDADGTSVVAASFQTNLFNMIAYGGTWKDEGMGLYSNAVGKGDTFLISRMWGDNFIYTSRVKFLKDAGTAGLIFRSRSYSGKRKQDSYCFSINRYSNTCVLTRYQEGMTYELSDECLIEPAEIYELKVVAVGSWLSCYVNDVLVASTGDYVLQSEDHGQDSFVKDGFFGLRNLNGDIVFMDAHVVPIDDENTPILSDVRVISRRGTVEEGSQFVATEPVRIWFVSNETDEVDIETQSNNTSSVVTVRDAAGTVYPGGTSIPVNEGINYVTVTSSSGNISDSEATVNYRLLICRRKSDESCYNEPYRDQYHYSVREGLANDPNGLIYSDGTWHMFYQYAITADGGSKHWAHAISRDLLTWKDMPVAFYPDANGSMFSGCIVADEKNTSGLFSGSQGGLVALISVNGNGQRIKAAYSEDEGITWTKLDSIVLDWTDDPLSQTDLRDPKVFRWENKWFMVIAGGPLRIYSSDNLLDWTCESFYPEIITECPDLYPVMSSDSKLKWVLSKGGRYYKVGNFGEINGRWTFTPDDAYATQDGIMNFGSNSYAAMTYYVQDFGSANEPSIPRLIELNWMNSSSDNPNTVGEKISQNFNGTFNLFCNIGLVLKDGIYRLTQTPLEYYDRLRDQDNAIIVYGAEAGEDNKLLEGFSGDCYEIVSRFFPGNGTKKIGFELRCGRDEKTLVVYDLENDILSIDRSRSGSIFSEKFAEVNSQTLVRNKDGSIDLNIFVDRMSVEVFANGGEAVGTDQIFPGEMSLGVRVIVDGETSKVDLEVYNMKSIWDVQ